MMNMKPNYYQPFSSTLYFGSLFFFFFDVSDAEIPL